MEKINILSASKKLGYLILIILINYSCEMEDTILETDYLLMSINSKGRINSLMDKNSTREYLADVQEAPLLTIRTRESSMLSPISLQVDKESNKFTLSFKEDIKVEISYQEKPSHISFEVISATPIDKVPVIIWGPYPTIIKETIGEVIGVVRNKDFAIGIQALNIKTIGGFPENNEGSVPNRKGAAKETEAGSLLQAFSMGRSFSRTADVWGGHFKNMPIIPIQGETVIGSKIGIFGCPSELALYNIGKIEIDEGLPHPEVDGIWIKQHPHRSKAYFITNFSEKNFDKILDYTKKAGMNAIYHEGIFKNWGKFEINKMKFPNGRAGLKSLVEKAKTQGIRVGAHTLTTFITRDDPFVSPIPNAQLAITGSGILTNDLGTESTEISINSKEFFEDEKFNSMHTVKIDNELIRYRSVSKKTPYKLLDCERGAFRTTVNSHSKGAQIDKLLDHPYKVFFPNFVLQKEMAQNMVDFFNETGVSQMDFDGHEGALATGQGNYSIDDFANRVFRGTKNNLVNGSSRITHYYWHINHYINWGEPWYGGFRQSQSEYRFNNQPFLEANYLPNMLGWFSLREDTTQEDIEWMLARGAGYHAGFALYANLKALKANKNTDELLDLIRIWEKARLSKAFTKEQRLNLKDLSKEFHLEEITDDEWKLMMFQDYNFSFDKTVVQPGQPTFAEWRFANDSGKQPFQVQISLDGEGTISNIFIEVSNYAIIKIPVKIKTNEILSIDASGYLTIVDSKGKLIKKRKISNLPVLGNGSHTIQFDCKLDKGNPKVKVKIRLNGKEEIIKSKI